MRTPEEVTEASRTLSQALLTASGKVALCADYRDLEVLAPPAAEALTNAMRRASPRVERSAILTPAGPTVSMQIERIVREAGHPTRRTFRDPAAAEAYLAPCLDEDDALRLRAFLRGTA